MAQRSSVTQLGSGWLETGSCGAHWLQSLCPSPGGSSGLGASGAGLEPWFGAASIALQRAGESARWTAGQDQGQSSHDSGSVPMAILTAAHAVLTPALWG